MALFSVALDGVSVVLTIRGQDVRLTGKSQRVDINTASTGSGSTPTIPNSFSFEYDTGVNASSVALGTPGQVLEALEQLTSGLADVAASANVPQAAASTVGTLKAQWETIVGRVQNVPVLSKVVAGVTAAANPLLTTEVYLTRLHVGFTRIDDTYYFVGITVGLDFVPNPATTPVFLGVRVTRLGGQITLSGAAKSTDLKFS